jgi:hypothetical protein
VATDSKEIIFDMLDFFKNEKTPLAVFLRALLNIDEV